MAETKCEFDLLQRLVVPNGDNIVGVVIGRHESVEQPPMYSLSWTGLNGRSQGATFSEAEVRLFNPPARQIVSQPTDSGAFTAALKEATKNIKPRGWAHVTKTANRNAARKSKSKSKRK